MAIDLKNLIDQVLGMARDSMDMKKRKFAMEDLSGNDLTQQRNYEIQKELNKQRGQMEQTSLEGKNRLAEREMINSGALEQAKERTAGEIARQTLANEADRYKVDKGLQSNIYTEDTKYAINRDTLNKGYDPELIKAHAAIIANVNSSPEAVAASNAAIDFYTKNAVRKSLQQPAAEETPAAVPAPAAPAAPAEVKVGPLDFDKPDDVPGTKSAGRKSMEFRDPTSTDPAAAAAAKKKSEERLLYGTKPQRRGWF